MAPAFFSNPIGWVILVASIVAVGFFFYEASAQTSLITYQETFCGLQKYYGFDCMTIQIWDSRTIPCGFSDHKENFACADWQTYEIRIAAWAQNSIDENYNPLLWHEIKHLKCKCNWHD